MPATTRGIAVLALTAGAVLAVALPASSTTAITAATGGAPDLGNLTALDGAGLGNVSDGAAVNVAGLLG
jgi:hypothetical protein